MDFEGTKLHFSYFRLQEALDKYYNHPLRDDDVDSIEHTYTRVKEDEAFVPAEELYSKETEFLLTEGRRWNRNA